ncbi:MAG TPA: phenylalanine--tRNA ligase subunit beta [Dehalococcoidia bacterium]|nr:phenylalanine--tRNA ligase subunit beta [Dehalococcoidia bacterium]
MLVSLKWLSEYVALTLPPRELAHKLTIAGVKVERIISRGAGWDKVTVGRVLAVEPHPNAERLRLVTVDIGDAEKPRVVCGAPNVAPGQKVAFASVGAELIGGRSGQVEVLRPAVIRGVESAGMVCSEKELGLSEDHTGILELPEDAPVGTPLRDYLGDTIFDIEVTPNRPDLLSVLGVAWEVAAQTRGRVHEPERVYQETAGSVASAKTSVTVEDKDLCPRYIAGIVERLRVGPSPQWMQERLLAAGMRPINNVVDITNYVMLETGQPLHAFDFRKLSGQRIVVRRARPGETITTLDGVERRLTPDVLVIADAQRAQAIAGVMGGADAEVSQSTTTVLLEAANFNPVNIRATEGALGLRTEASIRFEKGLHPDLADVAARRAMKLLTEVAGGRASKGLVDAYVNRRKDTRVEVTRERIARVLGVDVGAAQVRSALSSLGFTCRVVPPDRYVVKAPYWRTDINIADDVIEEIARVIGYDRIEPLPLAGSIPEPVTSPVREMRERLRDAAAAAGLQEVISYPLTNEETLAAVVPKDVLDMHPPLRLENPMSSEAVVLRESLRASLLQTAAANLRYEKGTVALFESARVYLSREGDLPEEREQVAGVITGHRQGRWGEPTGEAVDFYDAKGLLEEMLERAGVAIEFRAGEDFGLLRGRTARIYARDEEAGVLGQVHPKLAERFGVEGPAFLFELDVERLLAAAKDAARHAPLSRFPAVIQDIAVVVDSSVPAARVQEIIASSALVARVQLFDVFEGEQLGQGRRSLAFAVHFQSPERTLTDEDVADARRRIIRRLEREVGAELRGG